ncbi:unnamed protein product [Phyllotreta striolata]|uniref:Odorant receptor n=1 Tax=Phyllotreta striolata TaxID=444603 RepID=A0A9N9XH67_PHYSR|nr:unnamed protein product [Phyllotreta striolata]
MTNQQSELRKSLKLLEFLLNVNGLLPGKKFKFFYSIFSYAFVIFFVIMIPVLGYVNIYLAEPSKRVDYLDKSFVYLEMFVLVFKHWPFITNPNLTKILLDRWNESLFNTQVDVDKHIIAETLRRRRIWIVRNVLITAISPIILIQSMIFSSHDELMLPIWLPVDVSKNPVAFTVTNMYIVIGYMHGFFGYFAVDILVISYIMYCATEMRLIKYKLKNVEKYIEKEATNNSDKTTSDGLPHKKIYDQIIQCVKVYDAVWKYAQELESTYSFGIFIQFFVASMVLSICMYNISKIKSIIEILYTASFLLPTILVIYYYCDQGSLIIDESTTIGDAIMKSPWYTYDEKTKHLLITFMERTKRPIKFTVGKLVDVSLETFVLIINRSYSLLAVLKNFY